MLHERDAQTLPAPSAARLRRPGWRDPRLLVGLLLVALSVVLGSVVVSAASASTPVYVARGALTPGEPVASDRLRVVEVRLGREDLDRYLDATEPVPEGLVAVRVVEDGELVPRTALAPPGSLDASPVALDLDVDPGSAVVEGARVDVWFVPALRPGGADGGDPELLAESLVVHAVTSDGGALQSGRGTTVHVLVPTDLLPAVLRATSADGSVRVLPELGGA